MFSKQDIEKYKQRVTIMRKVDKKSFINALKAISTPYVDIIFNNQDSYITLRHPKGYEEMTILAKNNP